MDRYVLPEHSWLTPSFKHKQQPHPNQNIIIERLKMSISSKSCSEISNKKKLARDHQTLRDDKAIGQGILMFLTISPS